MTIENLVKVSHQYSRDKGFWDGLNPKDKLAISTKLMLIVTEVAECMEALRQEGFGNLGEEMADILIRVADLAGALDIDLQKEVKAKALRNSTRPYMHGKVL